jgi:hypothetical protein
MRFRHATCGLYVFLVTAPVAAQTAPPTAPGGLVPAPPWAYNDLACAPSLRMEKPAAESAPTLRIVGAQNVTHRDLLSPSDILVVSGGSNAGVQTGQRYFVRRVLTSLTDTSRPSTIHTAGWIQILGVDMMVSTAKVLHACDGILLDDYLEPFVEPMVAAGPVAGDMPQHENMGHIVTGVEGLHTAAVRNYMTIDRGTEAGVVVGQRFLVFRDKRNTRVETTGRSKVFESLIKQSPLVEIGEVLVVSVRANDATVWITASKTAITTGDLVAPIR